jgi:small subunit ribosomal protein S7
VARKKRDFTRELLTDPKYGDLTITRIINVLMKDGKRSVAETAFYKALDHMQEKTGNDPLDVFHKAIANVRPVVEVRSRRVGGATYQVPTEVRSRRGESLAIRWIISAANSRSERELRERLANEFIDAANNRGIAVKKRDDTHRMAEANKAFAHFRW